MGKSRKEKDMIPMNRLYDRYNEYSKDYYYAQLESFKLGFSFICSSIDKHRRENCVLDISGRY